MNGAWGTYGIRNGYKMYKCKCEANGNFVERYSLRLDDNIKIDSKGMGWDDVDWIDLRVAKMML